MILQIYAYLEGEKDMSRIIFIILMAILFVSTGCSMEEEEVMAGFRPDKYWEGIWKVEEKESHLEISPQGAAIEAFCRIRYIGDKPAENVRVIIKSPLTYMLIDDSLAAEYDLVQPGQEVEFHLKHEVASWQEKVTVGVFEDKLKDDFSFNSYVEVNWSDSREQYHVQFFDWGDMHH